MTCSDFTNLCHIKRIFSEEMLRFDNFFSKNSSKRNISAENAFYIANSANIKKIREITAGHLYQGLGQSPQSFLMFARLSKEVVVSKSAL